MGDVLGPVYVITELPTISVLVCSNWELHSNAPESCFTFMLYIYIRADQYGEACKDTKQLSDKQQTAQG